MLTIAMLMLTACNDAAPPSDHPIVNAVDHADDRRLPTTNLVCKPTVREVCTTKGCEPIGSGAYARWTPATSTYERCDAKGCDAYTAVAATSGIFTNISLGNGSATLKIAEDGAFVETATLGISAFVYAGQCEKR